MAHVFTSSGIARRDVPDEWLEANAKIMAWVSGLTGRGYIAVKCGPGLAAEAGTAQFVPSLAEIHVSTEVLAPGLHPSKVNPTDALFRAKNPLLVGGILHEVFHEAYSRWVPRDLAAGDAEGRFKGRLSEVLVALEESRIEKRGIGHYSGAREYLPAIVFDLLAREFHGGDDPYSASIALALILGRVEAGTITNRDAEPFRDLIAAHLSDEQMEALLELVREYHALPFPQWDDLPLDTMESVARRWLEALGDDPDAEQEGGTVMVLVSHDDGEGEEGGSGGSGEGQDDAEGEGEGEGTGEGSEGSLGAAVREAAAEAKHDEQMSAGEKAKTIQARRDKQAREEEATRHADAERENAKVFPPSVGAMGSGGQAGRHSSVTPRDPEQGERAAATILARKIAKAVLVEPARTTVASVKPGKRLRGRAAVQRRAQEAQGRVPTAKQWQNRAYDFTDDVPVTVGAAVDISGSMNALAAPLATTGYVVGNAVEKAGGTYAQVVFGAEVTGVIRAGRKVREVPYVYPSDPWENIKSAVLALDNELDLIDGEGVRILVLASDGMFVQPAQKAWADEWFPRMARKGVIILHLDFERGWVQRNAAGSYNPRHNNPLPPVEVHDHDPRAVANLIGDKIIEAVNREKQRRQAA